MKITDKWFKHFICSCPNVLFILSYTHQVNFVPLDGLKNINTFMYLSVYWLLFTASSAAPQKEQFCWLKKISSFLRLMFFEMEFLFKKGYFYHLRTILKFGVIFKCLKCLECNSPWLSLRYIKVWPVSQAHTHIAALIWFYYIFYFLC